MLVERGRIVRVLTSRAAVRRARREAGGKEHDLGDVVVTAGLVNAHTHLELGTFHGAMPERVDFAAWVGALVARRARTGGRAYEIGVEKGARRLLATGTTTAGDIDATDAVASADRSLLRVRRFRELIDLGDETRTPSALRRVSRALRPTRTLFEGLSPHAPFTTSARLRAAAHAIARRRRIPVQIHWSESADELDWLLRGAGPFAAVLPPSPRRAGLALLEEAQLVGRATTLVHGNLPRRGEPARIAAAGATVVHCPGSHAFFGRDPFPWRRYLDAGVPLALGTDSLASNDDLDLRREMRRARESAPFLDPALLWAMGTTAAARGLDLAERVGGLEKGFEADFVAWRGIEASTRDAALDALTAGAGELDGCWVGGHLASGNGAPVVS